LKSFPPGKNPDDIYGRKTIRIHDSVVDCQPTLLDDDSLSSCQNKKLYFSPDPTLL
jgi:hypothetical protein